MASGIYYCDICKEHWMRDNAGIRHPVPEGVMCITKTITCPNHKICQACDSTSDVQLYTLIENATHKPIGGSPFYLCKACVEKNISDGFSVKLVTDKKK